MVRSSELKRVLIISPYFPPVNAADMQRVRMSLAYYRDFQWEAEVVTVDARFADLNQDQMLCESIPDDIRVHHLEALNKRWTSKFGLGSIALRSIWFYRKKVNKLLKKRHFDLIYFSTTQFPVCILGAYWKKRFGIPYVIDFQDPWYSDYYEDKPKNQRPPKYWFSYYLNKYLEPIALKQVGGLISVSQAYIDQLRSRYVSVRRIPSAVIPFGFLAKDLNIAAANRHQFSHLLDPAFKNIVYVGRGGADLHVSIAPLFEALKLDAIFFKNIRIYFIGTSYAPPGKGKATILPLAQAYGLQTQVIELPDRISFYHALCTLQQADVLFIPGSDDSGYMASKIYSCLAVNKQVLAIFHSAGPAIDALKCLGVHGIYEYQTVRPEDVADYLKRVLNGHGDRQEYNRPNLEENSARALTRRQCQLFDQVI